MRSSDSRPYASLIRLVTRPIVHALTCFSLLMSAPSYSTDLSDLWWNSNESGWGVNVAHQANVLFITLFLYDQGGQPVWYVGSNTAYQGTDATGALIYRGPLYQTAGPWHGGSFNPNAVTVRQVGTVTFTVTSVTTATLSYTTDGISVSKSVTRQTFQNNPNIAGSYFGGWTGTAAGCISNGTFRVPAVLNVTRSGASATIAIQGVNGSCTFAGPYTQSGRMGRVVGSISCTGGVNGTVSIFEVEANGSGLTARYTGNYGGGCTETGRFGGVRDSGN